MRSAALIFGLLAAVLGGAAIAYGNIETGLAASALLGGHRPLIYQIACYLIPVLGLVGAILVLLQPKLGGALLLLTAAAWLAAGAIAAHGAILFAAAPLTFAGAGGLVALFARRKPGREVVRRDFAPEEGDFDEDEDFEEEDEEPAYAPRPRGLRGRDEPAFEAVPTPRRPAKPAPRYRNAPIVAEEPDDAEEIEEDYVDAEEAAPDEEFAAEEPDEASIDAEPYEDDAPQHDEAAEDEPPEDEPEEPPAPRAAPQRSGRPRQAQWSLPDPEQSPAPPRARQRPVPERQAPQPSRRQPAAPPREEQRPARRPPPPPPTPEFDITDEDFAPPRREFQPRPRNDYRDFEPYEPAGRRGRRSGPGGLLRLLVLLVFILVVVGVAAAVYFDYEQGSRSVLFGTHGQTVASTSPAAAPAPASPPDAGSTPSPAAPAVTATPLAPAAPATPPAADAAPPAAPAPTPVAPPAPQPAAPVAAPADTVAAAPGLSDPFKYCQSVQTVDAPDAPYSGPAAPAAVLTALNLVPGVGTDQVHWRCANQDLLACNANHTAACDLTPTVDLMLSYCAQHPGAQNIPAPNGSWSCNGKRPVIPRDQQWPVDARGFYPGAWVRVPPPQGG